MPRQFLVDVVDQMGAVDSKSHGAVSTSSTLSTERSVFCLFTAKNTSQVS